MVMLFSRQNTKKEYASKHCGFTGGAAECYPVNRTKTQKPDATASRTKQNV